MVAIAAAVLVTFIGGLYFITHHKKEESETLQSQKVTGNGLPPKPEERWRYIKELESRQPGVRAPTEPSAGGEVKTPEQLTPEQRQLLEQMQADMRQMGADVSLIGEEESSIYARQRDGRFGMIFHRTWGAPYDPHAFLSSMRVPSHADFQAQQGLADKPLIDKEIGEVLATHDETQRQALYRDILTRLHDEAVYLPISYISMMVVSKPELGNIPYAPIATEIPFEQIKPVKP